MQARKILIVKYDAHLRQDLHTSFNRLLKVFHRESRAISCPCIESALTHLEQETFDAVITGGNFIQNDASDLYHHLRSHPVYQQVPIVVHTKATHIRRVVHMWRVQGDKLVIAENANNHTMEQMRRFLHPHLFRKHTPAHSSQQHVPA